MALDGRHALTLLDAIGNANSQKEYYLTDMQFRRREGLGCRRGRQDKPFELDASIGAKTNVGAGTITCNYDGFAKYRTEVGAHAFIICRGPPTRPWRWDSPLHNRD